MPRTKPLHPYWRLSASFGVVGLVIGLLAIALRSTTLVWVSAAVLITNMTWESATYVRWMRDQ